MARTIPLSFGAAMLAIATPGIAQDREVQPADGPMAEIGSETSVPVKLVEFDGTTKLLKVSERLRIWRTHLTYELAVDAQGQATDCKIHNMFRRTYVMDSVCEVLMEHHRFEPARSASDEPVAGSYMNTLAYADLRERR